MTDDELRRKNARLGGKINATRKRASGPEAGTVRPLEGASRSADRRGLVSLPGRGPSPRGRGQIVCR